MDAPHDPYANLTPAQRALWLHDPYASVAAAQQAAALPPPKAPPKPLLNRPSKPPSLLEINTYPADPYGDGYGADAYGSEAYGADAYGAEAYGADPYGADAYGYAPVMITNYQQNGYYQQQSGPQKLSQLGFFGGNSSIHSKNPYQWPTRKRSHGARGAPQPPANGNQAPLGGLNHFDIPKGSTSKIPSLFPSQASTSEKKPKGEAQQEPLLPLEGDIPEFLDKSKILTETRKRKIKYRILLWCRIVKFDIESNLKCGSWLMVGHTESTCTVRIKNFFPEIFAVSATSVNLEELSYELIVQWLLFWYYKSVLSDKMIFNLYTKDSKYSTEMFKAAKRCYLTVVEEIGKKTIKSRDNFPDDLRYGKRLFTEEEKQKMKEACERAAARISNNDLAEDTPEEPAEDTEETTS
ncbi:unnamed protein product [Bursaphelenchus okinawaensis]|uniref:Uncharacterized protein n=1 Tax=Bursaphelenchus okinawaensis TaxID=465554 RepID=A0A811KBD0_9BILA|nr:unnamed protein product [Bursaphelenchus okinawaensis]CAG9098964.1 unnamed protein product [Bursaphelenchus okinawaensis]